MLQNGESTSAATKPAEKTRIRTGKHKEILVLRTGCVATLVSKTTGGDLTLRYHIDVCDEPDLQANPPKICFRAPLIQPFLGKEVGHVAEVMRRNKRLTFRLAKIEPPTS